MSKQHHFSFKISADASDAIKAFRLTKAEQKALADKTATASVRMKAASNAALRYKNQHALLVRSYKAGAISLDELNKELDIQRGKLKAVAGATAVYEKNMRRTSKAIFNVRNAALGLASAFSMREMVREITDVATATQRWESRLKVATGSASAAAAEINWVREQAKGLSLDMRASAEGYSSFATAARLAGLEMSAIRETFIGVQQASAALQLDTVKQQQALTALSQMASKGVVSMEELRQQLGEAIPGATTLAADAMGMTTAEFNKAVESGNVLASDLLPRLGAELQKTFEGVQPDGYVAAVNQMKNAWFEFVETLSNSGALDLITKVIQGITAALTTLTPVIGAVVSGFEPLMAILGGWVAYRYLPGLIGKIATATKSWAAAQALLNAAQSGSLFGSLARKIGRLTKSINLAKGSISTTANALFSLKGAIGAAASAFAGWEIGKWAYENFTAVRVVSYATVSRIMVEWEHLPDIFFAAWNSIKASGIAAIGEIKIWVAGLATKSRNAALKIENFFKGMYLSLLKMTKSTIEGIGSAFKRVSANIKTIMAGALQNIRDSLAGIRNVELFGKTFELLPDSLIQTFDGKINQLKNSAR